MPGYSGWGEELVPPENLKDGLISRIVSVIDDQGDGRLADLIGGRGQDHTALGAGASMAIPDREGVLDWKSQQRSFKDSAGVSASEILNCSADGAAAVGIVGRGPRSWAGHSPE